ncbi:putative receptor recognizing protein Gp38 [Escherichia coli DEC6E]|nr:putative receptor recognizing protein Gp38 [Escherichia coli DEC6E]
MGAAGTKLGLSKPFMMSQMVGRTMGCKIATEYYKWKSSDKVDNWGAVGADWPLEEKVKVQLQTPQAADQGGW